jgi:hypothetical protein
MNLFKSLLIVVLILTTMTVAQEGSLFSIFKIEGKTCIASTQEEFETLKALVDLIDAMRQAKSNGSIDSTFYAEKVASYMKDARTAGIRMRKSKNN